MDYNIHDYLEDFWGEDDDFYLEPLDQKTDWEKECERNNITAPDPDDLCPDCGRSYDRCDCP